MSLQEELIQQMLGPQVRLAAGAMVVQPTSQQGPPELLIKTLLFGTIFTTKPICLPECRSRELWHCDVILMPRKIMRKLKGVDGQGSMYDAYRADQILTSRGFCDDENWEEMEVFAP